MISRSLFEGTFRGETTATLLPFQREGGTKKKKYPKNIGKILCQLPRFTDRPSSSVQFRKNFSPFLYRRALPTNKFDREIKHARSGTMIIVISRKLSQVEPSRRMEKLLKILTILAKRLKERAPTQKEESSKKRRRTAWREGEIASEPSRQKLQV